MAALRELAGGRADLLAEVARSSRCRGNDRYPTSLILRILGAIDEFQRELIIEGTREGLDAARTGGRKPKLNDRQAATVRRMYQATSPDGKRLHTVAEIAEAVGVHPFPGAAAGFRDADPGPPRRAVGGHVTGAGGWGAAAHPTDPGRARSMTLPLLLSSRPGTPIATAKGKVRGRREPVELSPPGWGLIQGSWGVLSHCEITR